MREKRMIGDWDGSNVFSCGSAMTADGADEVHPMAGEILVRSK
jgi:hypothetical protein